MNDEAGREEGGGIYVRTYGTTTLLEKSEVRVMRVQSGMPYLVLELTVLNVSFGTRTKTVFCLNANDVQVLRDRLDQALQGPLGMWVKLKAPDYPVEE